MDSNLSSWFGEVYGKFEAEVEEIINQSAVKYVENQVKTVGDCVKKLYSDVIEDLIHVSSDDSANNFDSGFYDNSEVDTEREDVEVGSVNLIEDNSLSTKLDECKLHNLSEVPSQDPTVLVKPNITEVLTGSEVSEAKLPVFSDDSVNSELSAWDSVNNIDSGYVDKSEVEVESASLSEDLATNLDECVLHNLSEMPSQDPTVLVKPNITEVLIRSEVSEAKLPVFSDDSVNSELPAWNSVNNIDSGYVDKSEVEVESASLSEDLATKLDECVLHNLCELQSQDSIVLVKPNITEVLTISEISETKSAKDGDCTAEEAKMHSEMEESREIDECFSNISIYSSSSEEISLSDHLSSSSEAISLSDYVNEGDVLKISNGTPYQPIVDKIAGYVNDMEALQDYEQQVDDMNQDESCVLVDENELFTISSIIRMAGQQRSYKKKIRDLLSMRRWSSRRNHEREYTAFSHQGSWITEASSSALESFNSNLQPNILESGWEIL